MTEPMTSERPLPAEAPTIDPSKVEAAATAAEQYLEARRAWHAVMRQVDDGVIDDSWPLTTATLQLLLADYRHHRPTQWAYDAACAALRKRPTHSEHEKALAEVDRLNQRVASLDRQLDAAMRRIVALRTGADEDEESAR